MTTILNNALLTVDERIETANAVMNDWTAANTYLAVGGEVPYANNDMLVPVPNGSIDYLNATFRNMIALKKITAADLAFMVPRVDWQTGVTYAAWDDAVDMYST
ncbi:MAG: hypothetical protein ACREQ5_05330, partial [Candidatus Dormibacteria bacterium]